METDFTTLFNKEGEKTEMKNKRLAAVLQEEQQPLQTEQQGLQQNIENSPQTTTIESEKNDNNEKYIFIIKVESRSHNALLFVRYPLFTRKNLRVDIRNRRSDSCIRVLLCITSNARTNATAATAAAAATATSAGAHSVSETKYGQRAQQRESGRHRKRGLP